MTTSLKPYPEYKDSGVPWLREIPAHWDARRAKFIFREVNDRSKTGQEELLSVSHITGVTPRSEKNITMFMAESYENFKLCQPGDLVINTMWAWMGALGISGHHGIVSYSYSVYRLRTKEFFNPRLLDRLLRTDIYVAEYNSRSTGINSSRLRLYPDDFFQLPILIPPLEEQDMIVAFLDHVDRRVNRFIRAKRRLIALLNEQKQAIIHRAVTRGLDPDVRLKSSGVEWLGDVPDHWEVKRLKDVLRGSLTNGLFKKKDAYGSGVPLINVQDLYQLDNCIRIDSLEKVNATEAEIANYHVQAGDVFFVRSSLKLEGTGRSAFVDDCDEGTVFECHVVRARPDTARVIPRFLIFQLNSHVLRNYLISRANTVTMSTIAQGVISSLPIWLPPPCEQERILENIDRQSKPLDSGIRHANREIDLIREYRTRLIADVVTGKLDVRGVDLAESDELVGLDEPLVEEGNEGDDELELIEESIDADD